MTAKVETVSKEQFRACHALMMLFYNTSGQEFAEMVFPGREPEYQAEYAKLYQKSYAAAMGKLDTSNQKRVIQMALERYGSEGDRHWDAWEAWTHR